MELVIEVDGYETPLLAEMPETRQYFFLFFPDVLFLPVVSSPAVIPADAGEGASFSRTRKSVSILFLKIFLAIADRHE
jgi:hypothetical protein